MVRFAIIGTGRISDWVLKGAVQDERFQGVAVCSRSLDKAKEFIASHKEAFSEDAKAYDCIDEMLQDPNIDAVYIGTPNTTHHDYTIASLNAGKHVLCEKPLACSASEAKEMVAASKANGKALMEAMISTLNPNFLAARDAMKSVGDIRHYSSFYCQYSSKYDALKQGVVSNSFNPHMGGGALPDVGIYTTYPVVALFGKPEKVQASHIYVDSPVGKIEVHGSVLLEYPGMTASLTYSKAVDSKQPTEISAEGGIISMDEVHICRKVTMIPHGEPTSGRKAMQGMVTLREGLDHDEYYYEFKEFIDVVERGGIESEINSQEVSIQNMEVMDMLR